MLFIKLHALFKRIVGRISGHRQQHDDDPSGFLNPDDRHIFFGHLFSHDFASSDLERLS